MRSKTLRTLGAIAAVTGLLSFGAAHAQEKTVTFAHQDMLVPLRLVMESGEVEKATGYKINWRMFSGGGDVIRAMASGDVQMGEVDPARLQPQPARVRTSRHFGFRPTLLMPKRWWFAMVRESTVSRTSRASAWVCHLSPPHTTS